MIAIAETFDPVGAFAGAAGAMFIAVTVITIGLIVLFILATYWLIRLAVRHGTMDTARWQVDGMPSRDDRRRRRDDGR